MASVIREPIGLLNDKLIVKVNKEDYYPSFQKAIKEYSKKANIPGFRKGMVPVGMVKKMYGASIFYDEIIKVVDKEIQQYLTNEKPDIFAQPLPMRTDLKDIDMNNPADYDFTFEIGLKPEIKIPDLQTVKPTFNKIKVTDEMINQEIERLQARYGKMSEPETVTTEENVLNVTFVETDAEGSTLQNGISKDIAIPVKYFASPAREELKGQKKGDIIRINLNSAFEEKEREWILAELGLKNEEPATVGKNFNMRIDKVGLVEKREMNEEFFEEVFPGREIKTEDDFRTLLREAIQHQWDMQSRVQMQDQLYHILLEIPMEFPEEFLKKWMQKGTEKEKSPEQVETEFPVFKNQLKWMLISDKLIDENGIEVSREEIEEHMQKEIMQYFGQMKLEGDTSWMDSYIDRMMKDDKQVESTFRKLINNKLFEWVETQVTPVEKEITAEEFTAMQHDHHH